MKVEEANKFPITAKGWFSFVLSLTDFTLRSFNTRKLLLFKEPQKLVENQEQNKDHKPEPGLTEEQVETLKQVSSLVAMFQQEALNEKQTRLLAQLKALEKVRF